MSFRITTPSARHLAVLAFALAVSGACAKGADKTDMSASATAASAMPMDSASGTGAMAGHDMSAMSGDADHDFLRMMSDHHKGLILITRLTADRKDGGQVAADAKKLATAQDREMDHMVEMLRTDFKHAYAPVVMPQHQAMADELKRLSGQAYDRAFYQRIITHHQEALTMIDGYLPTAKNAMLKQMAEKMKTDQAREIADFQRKLAAMPS